MHHREMHRPSSTGHLIHRAVAGSRFHLWRRERWSSADEIRIPNKELWILHPSGRPMPLDARPERIHLLLLDGSWPESTDMARSVTSWGKLVNLPMTGESRFWLRAQQEGDRFSTMEALLFVLGALGLESIRQPLFAQFELLVYASLRSRGRKLKALEFLAGSCLPHAMPEMVSMLHRDGDPPKYTSLECASPNDPTT